VGGTGSWDKHAPPFKSWLATLIVGWYLLRVVLLFQFRPLLLQAKL
jgi:hypothetical protein